MRILGPDGKPLKSNDNVSDEVQKLVQRAVEVSEAGDPANALQQLVFAFQLDVTSDLVLDTTIDLLTQMVKLSGAESSDELQMFEHLRENRNDAEIYYRVGSRFLQLQQPFVGRPFLAHARKLIGSDLTQLTQATDVDLAQAAMDLGDYEGAIAAFHNLNDVYGGIPIWLVLEMAECYSLLRKVDEAEAVYQLAPPEAAAQFEGMEAVREEVGDLMARVRDFDGEETMGLQAWHYVQTRGILMEVNPDDQLPGERFVFFQPSEEDVAYVIGVTAAMLDQGELAPVKILWLGAESEPIARLFAEFWEIDPENLREYAPGDNTESEDELALLVMAHSYDVMNLPDDEAFFDLAQARAGLIVFALDVRWTERQPMCPDIAGFLTQQCFLPWETRFNVDQENQQVTRVEDHRSPVEVAASMAQQLPDDEECDDFAKEILESYAACTDLILNHRDGTLVRRPLVTHSPIKSPRMGF